MEGYKVTVHHTLTKTFEGAFSKTYVLEEAVRQLKDVGTLWNESVRIEIATIHGEDDAE